MSIEARSNQGITEKTSPQTMLDIFQSNLEEVIKTGKHIQLVNFAKHPDSNHFNIYSPKSGIANSVGPSFSEHDINSALTEFINQITPEGTGRSDLELGLKEEPDEIITSDHYGIKTKIWRWNAIPDGVVIGCEETVEDSVTQTRTWFIEGPKKKHKSGIVNKIKKTLLPFIIDPLF
jgi:hypothetical protein